MILVAAVLIGIVAAFGLYQYVQKVEEDAKPNPVTVYVLKNPIPRGTSFESAESSIVEKTIPAEFRPDTYVTNKAELANKVAITDLAANQVLVQNMFVNANVERFRNAESERPGPASSARPSGSMNQWG